MKAAIYCRVSTDNQEREGTSLQTQLENCLTYCQNKGYDVAYRYSEAYSGLSLERLELDKLRELVRTEAIDVVVCYSLDRLTRDPGHGVIITQELEKHGITLEAVTEDIDNSELGKLISYIRNYASKLEAEKIKDRTMRGKKARAKAGRMSGGFQTTYGYDYIPVSQKNGGRRVVNENEALWIRQIYNWLVNDGLNTSEITDRLTASNAPTKKGNRWNRVSVLAILKNPAYTGKTYAFTSTNGTPRRRPRADWIEIPGDRTPAIITPDLFESAQKQLKLNYENATRNNTKHQYLLRGHVRCRECGHSYVGSVNVTTNKSGKHYRRYYRCVGKWQKYTPADLCHNRIWGADKLESMVWQKLVEYISDHDSINAELEKEKDTARRAEVLENEFKQIERQTRAIDREQRQLLQWALKGFPEDQVEAECKRLNDAREAMKARKVEVEKQLKDSQDAAINVTKLEDFIRRIQDKLPDLDFEGKRLALYMLDITVWIDGENIEVAGTINPERVVIANTCSKLRNSKPRLPLTVY